LGALTSLRDVDEEREAAAWPVVSYLGTDRIPDLGASEWRQAVPIATGSWGRPPAPHHEPSGPEADFDLDVLEALPAALVGGPTPAPVAHLLLAPSTTPRQTAEQRLRQLRVPARSTAVRRRCATVCAELAVALVVVAAVAVGTSGRVNTTELPPAAAPALGSWWLSAVPAVTNLVGDLGAIERDTSSALNADPAVLGSDSSRLEQDIAQARRLPAPPLSAVALWARILAQFAGPQRTLDAAASTLSPATVALAHEQFAVAGETVVQLGEQLRAQTG
jgi:hypothetical protein